MSSRTREDYRKASNRSRRGQRRRGKFQPLTPPEPIPVDLGPQPETSHDPLPDVTTEALTAPEATEETQRGSGGAPEGPATQLFENVHEIGPDARMARAAFRRRWETPKDIAAAVLLKAGIKVLEDQNATPAQLALIGKMYLDVERQNQIEDHHQERMDYWERSLEIRAKASTTPGVSISSSGPTSVSIFLPATDEDEIERDIADLERLP